MVGGGPRIVAGVATVLLLSSVLTACASAGSATNGVTLSQTKSPVQLLRNETASRVPTAIIGEVGETQDTSVSCKAASVDPEGKSRKWKSSVLLNVKDGSAWRTTPVVDEIIASFVDEGWTAKKGPKSEAATIVLSSEKSATQIQFTTKEAKKGESGASITVTATGPCVETGGMESDEVKKLEKQDK